MHFSLKALGWITTTLLVWAIVPTPQQMANVGISRAMAQETMPNSIEDANRLSEEGKAQLYRGEYAAAREKFQRVLEIYREAGDRLSEAYTLNDLGTVDRYLGQYSSALELHQQALSIFQAINSRSFDPQENKGEIECLHHLGMAYRGLGQYSEAVEAFQAALTKQEKAGNTGMSMYFWKRIAIDVEGFDRRFESYPQAIEFYRQELAAAENLENDSLEQLFQQLHRQVTALQYLSAAYQDSAQLQEWMEADRKALDLGHQMLKLAREMRSREHEAIALMSLGDIHRYAIEQKQPALETYQQALIIYQELGNRVGEAQALSRMSDIYSDRLSFYFGQHQLALETSEQVLAIYQELENRSGEAAAWIDIGDAYWVLARNQSERADTLRQQAIEAYERALTIYRERNIHQSTNKIDVLLKLGRIYSDLKNHQQAIENMEEGLKIARNVGDRWREEIAANQIGSQYSRVGQFQQAIEIYQQGFNVAQHLGDIYWQSFILDGLVKSYLSLGHTQDAIDIYKKALALLPETSENNYMSELDRTASGLGKLYQDLGRYQEAIEVYQKHLERARAWGNRDDMSYALRGLSKLYDFLGYDRGKIELYQQDLEIARERGDEYWEYRALTALGRAYRQFDRHRQAIEIYQELLIKAREGEYWDDEIDIVNYLSQSYKSASQPQQAIEAFLEAIELAEDRDDRWSQANIWENLGEFYEESEQFQQAIEAYQIALENWQTIGQSQGYTILSGKKYEATRQKFDILGNLGELYRELGQFQKALDFYNRRQDFITEENYSEIEKAENLIQLSQTYHALGQETQSSELVREALLIARDRQNSSLLTKIASHLEELGKLDRASDIYEEALVAMNQSVLEMNFITGSSESKVDTLKNLAQLYQNRGETQQAIAYYEQALTVTRQMGSRNEEGLILQKIAQLFGKQNQPELSILFYKQAVNVWEAIRQDFQELPPELEQAYVDTVADSYRALADLLLQNDRILEAQQVLDLLKVQELDTYLKHVRGNEQTAQGVEYFPSELEILQLYNQAITQGRELEQLRTVPATEMTPQQQQRLEELSQTEREIRSVFNEFIDSPEVIAAIENLSRTAQRQNLDLESLNSLQNNLQNLQQNAVLLYPLILDNRLELVLVTPYSPPIRRTVPVKREELNRAITAFRQALESPGSDAQTPANQLYTWLIQPIENDLEAANAETLIYAPDAQLRYVPLAALHDGSQWLTERFRINHITAASLTDFNLQPPSELRIIAGAFSQGHYNIQLGDRSLNFSGLPFARVEVENLERDIPETTTLFDANFSPDAMVPQMDSHTIVHLATHAAFLTGQPEDSFILFGNGDRVTLNEIRTWTFRNVDLFVLSACETGLGGQLGDGTEILGFGYLMQQAGARAAIASLWAVDDGGTQTLMNAFYAALQAGNVTKAEALRQAQLTLITGDYSAVGSERGNAIEVVFAENLTSEAIDRLTHPYYWAPFILIGNGL
ncbi:MAG: tetratricopeptide repeat protein [Cyanobacteriota bacterium]|nr:tetratricopeptide repeat protein [Cyanobacteriota bacterium]